MKKFIVMMLIAIAAGISITGCTEEVSFDPPGGGNGSSDGGN
jgi:hypothetical protein